jgi:hypothetical protein
VSNPFWRCFEIGHTTRSKLRHTSKRQQAAALQIVQRRFSPAF